MTYKYQAPEVRFRDDRPIGAYRPAPAPSLELPLHLEEYHAESRTCPVYTHFGGRLVGFQHNPYPAALKAVLHTPELGDVEISLRGPEAALVQSRLAAGAKVRLVIECL